VDYTQLRCETSKELNNMCDFKIFLRFFAICAIFVVKYGSAQSQENTDVCVNPKNSEFFSKQWVSFKRLTISCKYLTYDFLFAMILISNSASP